MDTDRRHPRPSAPRITGPGELLQAIPYLLGFHPAASLVLVGIDEGCLVVTARLDLPDAGRPELVEHTLDAMSRGGSTSLIAAVYDDDSSPGRALPVPLADLLAVVGQCTDEARCELLEVLLVARGRWWSLMCDGPGCCPPEGRELPRAPSAFAAAATYEGVVALPDRAALEALFEPLPDSQRDELEPAIEAAEHAVMSEVLAGHAERALRAVKRALFVAARESATPGWDGPDDETVARFGVALGAVTLRDAVWMAVDDGRLDGRPLWRALARRLPAPYDAAPLFLFGWAAWRSGDATVAGIAAERAVCSDPGYSAADLLLAALARGVDPRRLPRLRLPRSA